MISVIITAYREEKSIGNVIKSIVKNAPTENYELILVCPDDPTLIAANQAILELGIANDIFRHIKDPMKGKPYALNLAFSAAKGEILILTDGDIVNLEDNSIQLLVNKLKLNLNSGGVSGRPVSADNKNSLFGYWGHLLADAAHSKRYDTLKDNIQENTFFVMSGYLMGIFKPNFTIPANILSDDAYISYKIANQHKYILYEPNAKVYIKYPTNIHDWFKQKCRSLGGYIQLHKMGIITHSTKSRSFWGEVAYSNFPIEYATTLKEFFWSLLLYPTRLYLWLRVFVERKFFEKSFEKTWVRVESTK